MDSSEKLKKHFRQNLERYVLEHPTEIVKLTQSRIGVMEQFFNSKKEYFKIHPRGENRVGNLFIVKKIPRKFTYKTIIFLRDFYYSLKS